MIARRCGLLPIWCPSPAAFCHGQRKDAITALRITALCWSRSTPDLPATGAYLDGGSPGGGRTCIHHPLPAARHAGSTGRRILRVVGILQLLDDLPEAVAQRPGRIWNVFARSLGEQGAGGRTALACRGALAVACAAPGPLGP